MVISHLKKYFAKRHRILLLGILCLFAVYISASNYYQPNRNFLVEGYAQANETQDSVKPRRVQTSQAPKIIQVIRSAKGVKRKGDERKILIGNVVLYHDGIHLYCDSVCISEESNSLEAFSNVHMVQGDTILLDGDYAFYDGNTKLAKVRYNVLLNHVTKETKLYTDSLDYDRDQNIGYYFNGGRLIDTVNVLTSDWGQYEPNISIATFMDNVTLTNPNFVLTTEKLVYSTETQISQILEASKIVSDSGVIYSSRGWYDTNSGRAVLLDQSRVLNKEGDRILNGDSIIYDRVAATGEAFGNMQLQDTTKHIILRGHYGFYNELTDYAMATDSAYCIEYSQGDSLYLHADTLKLEKYNLPKRIFEEVKVEEIVAPIIPDSMNLQIDSLTIEDVRPIIDSTEVKPIEYEDVRIIKAYHGVRFYRSDMQGVCDSMQFSSQDSVLHLYREPVIWHLKNQISGDTIDVFMNDSTINFIHVKRSCFAIEQMEQDTSLYNQMKGRSMKAFFEDGAIRTILVEGNAETNFYAEEEDKSIIGLTWIESSYMQFWIKDQKLEKYKAWTPSKSTSKGSTTPLDKLLPEKKQLEGFFWLDYLRPTDRYDIFRKVEKKATDIAPKTDALFDRED